MNTLQDGCKKGLALINFDWEPTSHGILFGSLRLCQTVPFTWLTTRLHHHLQGADNLNGDSSKSPKKVDVKELTTAVFDYIH